MPDHEDEAGDIEEVKAWAAGLQALHTRIAGRFARAEPRQRVLAYLYGLMGNVGRKNSWQLAEHAGERTPDGMHRLLATADWDPDLVPDDLRGYVVEHLSDPGIFTSWRLLPSRELGRGSSATCWRRFTEWANAGVFEQLHLQVLDRLGEQGRLEWDRAAVDTMSVRAQWEDHVGANPVDRGKPGSKLHLVCDGGGLPLTVVVTAAKVADTTMFQAVVADIPPARTPAGRRRTRPTAVHADKGYDSRANRAGCGGVASRCGSLGGRSSRQPGLVATAEGQAGAVVVELL